MSEGRRLYFAFGSNLYKERLSVSCPSAELINVAKLDNYKLSFFGYSTRWRGAVASIESSAGDYCWGAVWSISNSELVALDEQEGCGQPGGYARVTVEVCTATNDTLTCLTYEKKDKSQPGLPSIPYKDTIVKGGLECGLPKNYITMLQGIEDNSYNGEVNYKDKLLICKSN